MDPIFSQLNSEQPKEKNESQPRKTLSREEMTRLRAERKRQKILGEGSSRLSSIAMGGVKKNTENEQSMNDSEEYKNKLHHSNIPSSEETPVQMIRPTLPMEETPTQSGPTIRIVETPGETVRLRPTRLMEENPIQTSHATTAHPIEETPSQTKPTRTLKPTHPPDEDELQSSESHFTVKRNNSQSVISVLLAFIMALYYSNIREHLPFSMLSEAPLIVIFFTLHIGLELVNWKIAKSTSQGSNNAILSLIDNSLWYYTWFTSLSKSLCLFLFFFVIIGGTINALF